MSARSDHLEIEHKFVITQDSDFDLAAFRRAALALRPGPLRTGESRVQDTYFVIAQQDQLIFRHRHDDERHELTLKSRGGGDTEVRLEVNLRLDQNSGNQVAQVAAFLRPFGISWQSTIIKDIQVFYYSDCEIVYYCARAADRELRCVELEATHDGELAAAQKTLAHYEAQLGFAAHPRAQESLFELLLLPQMNEALGRPRR